MPRLKSIEPDQAEGKAAELYQQSQDAFGTVFNLFKGLANAPLALEAYMTLDKLIAEGKLSAAERDIVRLVASQFNDCNYCLAAHTMTAGMNGLSDEEILAVRHGSPDDDKQAALVTFANRVLETRGYVSDEDIAAFRDAGYGDEHIAEIVTIMAQKTISNLFNHIH
ncbi:MAG: carboxymuconolactone decarboxylase family protein, partial [Gammaproteobacteria bacterium]|nr:carboxymuconolactone decarboxylase family protein [Gammaproteobacteria bacterium]